MNAKDIRIHDVTKRYGAVTALDRVRLDVADGEFVTLLGPSGSGKTTLLMVVAGFVAPDEGRVYQGGADMTRLPPRKRGIGVVFQNYALFPHMSVRANVEYPLRMRRAPRGERGRLCAEALAAVRLEGLEERMPSQLSGGQKQRVALARALVFKPSLLLMDEPLSALDKNLREHMQIELKGIQERLGVTVLYVTHDQCEALTLSDRIAVVNRGRIEQFGPAAEVYDTPGNRFVAGFIGETNLFGATAPDGGSGTLAASLDRGVCTGARTGRPLAPGQRGWLSVRPEKLVVLDGCADGHCTLAGRLENVIHQGDTIKYFIRPDGTGAHDGDGLVVMKTHNHDRAPKLHQGDTITFGWRPDDATFVV